MKWEEEKQVLKLKTKLLKKLMMKLSNISPYKVK